MKPAHILERERYIRQMQEQQRQEPPVSANTIIVNVDTNIGDLQAEAEVLVATLAEGADLIDQIDEVIALRSDADEMVETAGLLVDAVQQRDRIIVDLLTALRLTAEYADLPARPGWSWFDAFNAYGAEFAPEQWDYILVNAGIDYESFIGRKIGAATTCWVGGTGDAVFDTESAIIVLGDVTAYVAALREQVVALGFIPVEPHEVDDANVTFKGDV